MVATKFCQFFNVLNMLTFQIISIVTIFLFLMGYFIFLIKKNNPPDMSKTPLLDSRDKLWVAGLSLIYFLISLFNFADFHSYDKAWQGDNDGVQLVAKFNHPEPLSALYYATGFVKGQYSISAADPNNQVVAVTDKSASLGYPPYFRWNKLTFDSSQAISAVNIRVDKGTLGINQLVALDTQGNLVTDYHLDSDYNPKNIALNDLVATNIPEHLDNNLRSGTIFDEIYYATSAYQYLQGQLPDVWVHPQLGILFIVIGVLIFGMSPFGWRIMPDLTSVLLVTMTYIFAKALFKDRRVAIAASLLMLFEFMHFTIGRTASIDPFVTLFLVIEYFFLYRYIEARKSGATFRSVLRYLLPAAVSFGLALSSKWNALYSAPFIVCILVYGELIKQKFTGAELTKNILNLALLFILLPLSIYLLVYIPYSLVGHTDNLLRFVYDTQVAIFDFNLHGLSFATHPYASNWWSWPLDKMPLSIYYWGNDAGLSSSVALLGNPAVYWLTWITTIMLGYLWATRQADFRAGFLFLAICAQYLPYALIARISFIYYFYSVTPFLILGISYFIYLAYRTEKPVYKYVVYAYLLVNIVLFALFFSSLAGLEVPRSYTLHWLRWMAGWNF